MGFREPRSGLRTNPKSISYISNILSFSSPPLVLPESISIPFVSPTSTVGFRSFPFE
ncbi:hypothetical protein SLEP1_g4409 [Rubroshorea leprosula]|uniref:Uncharacterized protein n=1 Tax=Rubroshorea leprosula TaxID=152421 RepID=A0AAV5HZ35_9ROSI|nr:hypothetical protein SLEP1_g4409 [Rubroshorea leprosula]